MTTTQRDILRLLAALPVEVNNRVRTSVPTTCAFTLMELVIVIAIIGTLAGLAVPLVGNYIDKARVARAKADIRTIDKEISAFSMEWSRYPVDLSEIGFAGIRDPYGNPYRYQPSTYIDKNGKVMNAARRRMDHNLVPVNTDYDLYSMGRDGLSAAPFTAKASRDDIVRANNGQFVGLVSAY